MANENIYRAIFGIFWIASLILFGLSIFILGLGIRAGNVFEDVVTLFPFASFIVLFICFTLTFGIFMKKRHNIAMILSLVLLVGEFLCVLVTSIALISDDQDRNMTLETDPDVLYNISFYKNPILWLKLHHWIIYIFDAIYLPLFVIQIYFINRYANLFGVQTKSINQRDGSSRKTTPYHRETSYTPVEVNT